MKLCMHTYFCIFFEESSNISAKNGAPKFTWWCLNYFDLFKILAVSWYVSLLFVFSVSAIYHTQMLNKYRWNIPCIMFVFICWNCLHNSDALHSTGRLNNSANNVCMQFTDCNLQFMRNKPTRIPNDQIIIWKKKNRSKPCYQWNISFIHINMNFIIYCKETGKNLPCKKRRIYTNE